MRKPKCVRKGGCRDQCRRVARGRGARGAGTVGGRGPVGVMAAAWAGSHPGGRGLGVALAVAVALVIWPPGEGDDSGLGYQD